MKEIVKYSHCFVCGDQNPIGLKARFFQDKDRVISSLTAVSEFEGYRGIYHGGIIGTMLDEVMIKAILANGIFAVTAELNIRFKRPVTTGCKLQFSGWITERKGRLFFTEGEATDESGTVYATAAGKYVRAAGELGEQLQRSIE